MPTPFSKYSGCGNDFILIDNRKFQLNFSRSTIAQLCHRQHGIGADGLIFLEISHQPGISYRMRIFNADGSEAEMCGNGLRCLAQFIRSIEITPEIFWIETMHQLMNISFNFDLVNISMPSPSLGIIKNLSFFQRNLVVYCMDTGVPHGVIFTDDLEHPDHFKLAPLIRFHEDFQPKGTNVNFAKILSPHSVAMRTYERGVEEETLSCGTGAVAVALLSALVQDLSPPITIHTRSGDCLKINFQKDHNHFRNVIMTGPAIKIFEGFVDF